MRLLFSTDKDPVSYLAGEEMIFSYSVQDPENDQTYYLNWTRSGDDGEESRGIETIAPGQTVTIKTRLNKPGFVFIRAKLFDASFHLAAEYKGGAGAGVEDILPTHEEPADFDEYWQKQRAILAEVPIKSKWTPIDSGSDMLDAWYVSVDCAGPRPVTGILAMKKGAEAKSMPARVSFHGYNADGSLYAKSDMKDQVFVRESAESGFISFEINAHGHPVLQTPEYYAKASEELGLYAFDNKENADPDTAYFRNMVFRVMRAIEFVKTLPQWDGLTLETSGGSQGGLQATWGAALVPGVTKCSAYITWCADLGGYANRLSGWQPEYAPGLGYYDAVFHSRRIPVICEFYSERFSLGDYTCPPSGVAAQYNALNCAKTAVWVQNTEHCNTPPRNEWQAFTHSEVAGHGKKGHTGIPEAEMQELPAIRPVTAQVGDWRLFDIVGREVAGFVYSDRINLKELLPNENFAELRGVIIAEEDGEVLFGCGADWWWECIVNGEGIFGRTMEMSELGNNRRGFEKTDWVFAVPVKKGDNNVSIRVNFGRNGFCSAGLVGPEFANERVRPSQISVYKDYCRFAAPAVTLPEAVEGAKNTFIFTSGSNNPAGLEYREANAAEEAPWQIVRIPADDEVNTTHRVELPLEYGKAYDVRSTQLTNSGNLILNSPSICVVGG